MKITLKEKEKFELKFINVEGYEYLFDHSIEYGIRAVETGELDSEGEPIEEDHVFEYNRSCAWKGVQDLGTIEDFTKSLADLKKAMEEEE